MENVHLVTLNQPLKGFRNFISSWILTLHDLTIVIDPGPRYSIPILIDALKKQGVKRIDYILLTHIHIDHAGGIATPPVFDYDMYLDSLKKAAAADVSHICFAHYGYSRDVKNVFDTAFDQLENWMATVEKHYRTGTEHFEKIVFEELLRNDRGVAHYHTLPEDIQEREKYFSLNSIRGMQEYLIKCNDA